MQHFKAPKEHLGSLGAEAAASLVAAAGDVAVILDTHGVIRDVAFQSEALSRDLAAQKKWRGQRWTKVVTAESRPKVEALLREANSGAPSSWRQINHPVAGRPDVPVQYSVIQAGSAGGIIAVGRDQRPLAALQQKLAQAQAAIESDYSRLRSLEMRYRLLFELSAEAVLIVDAGTLLVVEVNPAAIRLLGHAARRLVGRNLLSAFADERGARVRALLDQVRAGNRPDNVEARLLRPERDVIVSASQFRQGGEALFLVRLSSKSPGEATIPKLQSKMLKVVENTPDGFVVTGPDGRILTANVAFLEMVNAASEEQVRSQPLERWVGRTGVDADIIFGNLRQRGSVRRYRTSLRVDYGPETDVEISGVSVMNGGTPCFGFSLRDIGSGQLRAPGPQPGLHRSPEQLTELIGRMSLKDLVRETTDVIERLCIETAVEMTGGNRASAAELLGLSRQSLYVKLRRYGLSHDTSDTDERG